MANFVDKQCENIEWWTPDRVIAPITAYFSGIVLDPATAPSNPTNAEHFFTKEENGLLRNWDDGTFLNPPYGPEIKDWIEKLREEALIGHEIIALLPASRWEQHYFQRCVFNEALSGFCMIRKRLQFIDGNEGEVCKSNPYASLLYGYNITQWDWFRDCLSMIGTVVQVDDVSIYEE